MRPIHGQNNGFFFPGEAVPSQFSRQTAKAIGDLKEVIRGGRYYAPLAKILLSVIYLREKMPQQALTLMQEMERDFPDNPLIQLEVKKISRKVASLQLTEN